MAEAARRLQRWRRWPAEASVKQESLGASDRPPCGGSGDRSFAKIEQDGLEGLLDLEIRAA